MTIIALDRFRLKSLRIETEDFPRQEENQMGGLLFSWATATLQSDPCKYRLTFEINAQPDPAQQEEKLPWVQLCMEGFFSFEESVPEDKRQEIVMVNGSSILYGIARGLLAGVSGAFEKPILLPTVDMVSLVANRVQQQEGDKITTARKRKSLKPPPKRAAKKKP